MVRGDDFSDVIGRKLGKTILLEIPEMRKHQQKAQYFARRDVA